MWSADYFLHELTAQDSNKEINKKKIKEKSGIFQPQWMKPSLFIIQLIKDQPGQNVVLLPSVGEIWPQPASLMTVDLRPRPAVTSQCTCFPPAVELEVRGDVKFWRISSIRHIRIPLLRSKMHFSPHDSRGYMLHAAMCVANLHQQSTFSWGITLLPPITSTLSADCHAVHCLETNLSCTVNA